MLKIEKTKVALKQDTITCKLLDEMKYDFINRKTVVEQFLELFDNQSTLEDKISNNMQEIDRKNIQRNQILESISPSIHNVNIIIFNIPSEFFIFFSTLPCLDTVFF